MCYNIFFSVETGSAEVEPLYSHVDDVGEAHKCRFYRHMDVGTGGTEVWVLQARREPRDKPLSREARGCKHQRHGNAAITGTDMLLLEARVSTLWMYKSAVAEACVRMLG